MSPYGFWRKHFLPIEFVISVAATVALGLWLHYDHHARAGLCELLKDNRAQIYAALSAIWGSLLGFGIAALSIAMAFSQDARMTIVRESPYYKTMWSVFTNNISGMSIATLAALVALVLDRNERSPLWPLVVVAGSSLLAVFRLGNCVWLLEKLVAVILNKPEDDEAAPAAPAPLS